MFEDDYNHAAPRKSNSKIQKATINSVIRNCLDDSDKEIVSIKLLLEVP